MKINYDDLYARYSKEIKAIKDVMPNVLMVKEYYLSECSNGYTHEWRSIEFIINDTLSIVLKENIGMNAEIKVGLLDSKYDEITYDELIDILRDPERYLDEYAEKYL